MIPNPTCHAYLRLLSNSVVGHGGYYYGKTTQGNSVEHSDQSNWFHVLKWAYWQQPLKSLQVCCPVIFSVIQFNCVFSYLSCHANLRLLSNYVVKVMMGITMTTQSNSVEHSDQTHWFSHSSLSQVYSVVIVWKHLIAYIYLRITVILWGIKWSRKPSTSDLIISSMMELSEPE